MQKQASESQPDVKETAEPSEEQPSAPIERELGSGSSILQHMVRSNVTSL